MSGELKITKAVFTGSFPSEHACPPSDRPEYAFIGRSNVGKSSLINMMTGKKGLAKTSGTPGKTRAINLFLIDDQWQIADLPGYGYAKISKAERKRWESMIEQYLLHRPNLVSAFVLVDIRHPLQDIDRDFINWLGERRVPFAIIFTKADKLTGAKVAAHVRRIATAILESWESMPPYFVTSAETGKGREELLQYIAQWNAQREGK